MNKRALVPCLLIAAAACSSKAQGFVNLNFEDAKIVFVPGSTVDVATSNALPGWTAFAGTNQLSTIPYNDFAAITAVELYGSNSFVLNGNFSVGLDGGSISQTGLVPNGTESLLFDSRGALLSATLGGQNLSYEPIGRGTNPYGNPYTIYGASISPLFAGQMETLAFSGLGPLDDIQFSPELIPEPSAASLLLLGGGILFYVRKRRWRGLRCWPTEIF